MRGMVKRRLDATPTGLPYRLRPIQIHDVWEGDSVKRDVEWKGCADTTKLRILRNKRRES